MPPSPNDRPALRLLTFAVSETPSCRRRPGTRKSCTDSRSSNSLKSGTSTDDEMPEWSVETIRNLTSSSSLTDTGLPLRNSPGRTSTGATFCVTSDSRST